MKQKIWTSDFLKLCLANFFMFTSFFLLISALPLYVVNDLHGKESEVGLIISLFTVSSVLMRPYAGMLVDQLGRRKIVILAFILFVFSALGYFLAATVAGLLLLRLLHGVAFGLATTAAGTVATDLIPGERRGEGLGYFGMFNMIAMVMGPALGLYLIQEYSSYSLFFVSTITAIIALGLAYFVRYPEIQTKKHTRIRLSDWSKMIEPKAIPFSIPVLGTGVVYGGLVSFVSLYAKEQGNANWAAGFFMFFAGALVVSRAWAGKWADLKGVDFVFYPSMLFYVVGTLLLVMAQNQLAFVLSAVLIGFGYGATQPCLQAQSVRYVSAERRGTATATFYVFVDAGIGIGAFVLGWVAGLVGYRAMYLTTLLFIAFSIGAYIWARRKESSHPGDDFMGNMGV